MWGKMKPEVTKVEGLKRIEDTNATRMDFINSSYYLRAILAAAPSVNEVLAKPMVYEAWLKKVQEALNA